MNFRPVAEIENDIANKQMELDQTTHEIQRSILVNAITDLENEKKAAQEAQERAEVQEAEIESIILPYDFNEILSEEGHVITKANDMFIEVVKDTKRQANIEKNQALDEQKAHYEQKLLAINDDYKDLNDQHDILMSQNTAMAEREHQARLERDDAFAKRDAAFRQVQELKEENESLKIKLENAPAAKQTLDISPSDKLAQMVRESLEEKVNRGLSRWADIIPVQMPEVTPVNPVTEQETEPQEETFQSDQVQTTDGQHLDLGSPEDERESGQEESEVDYNTAIPFTRHHDAMLIGLEEMVKELTYRMDQHESKQAVA